MSDRLNVGRNTSFTDIYQQFGHARLGQGGDHLRGEGTALYLHKGVSRLGSAAQQERQDKWETGAQLVKAAINRQYGERVGDVVFQRISTERDRDLNRELKRSDLERIAKTAPQVETELQLRDNFRERRIDAAGAKQLLHRMAEVRQNLPEAGRKLLEDNLFGGGNLGIEVLHRNPRILTLEPSERDRVFSQEFDKLAARQLAILEQNRHAMGEQDYLAQKDITTTFIGIAKQTTIEFLNNPDNLRLTESYLRQTEGLSFDDAMSIVRMNVSGGGIARVDAAIDKLFAGGPLTEQERSDIETFFPARSS